MEYKYIVLDFGKVIAGPTTGHWDITPKFKELISDINIDDFNELRKKYCYLLNEPMTTLEQEYDMFFRFYYSILSELGYYSKDIINKIAYDRTYGNDKYTLYKNIHDELSKLKGKYRLIMLTDNWPCVINFLKDFNLDQYFEKVYISSFYGMEKNNLAFFEYPIKDFDIKEGDALFIDDNEDNLDNGLIMGFDCLLMDREEKVEKSKHRIIHNLYNL